MRQRGGSDDLLTDLIYDQHGKDSSVYVALTSLLAGKLLLTTVVEISWTGFRQSVEFG